MPCARAHHVEAICQPQLLATRLSEAGLPCTRWKWTARSLPEGRGHHSRHSAGGPFRRAQYAQPARYRDRGGGRPAGRHAADRAHAASVQQGRLAVVLYPAPHCVTTVSDHVRQHLIDRGVPPDRVATVYSPIVRRRPWSIPRCAASWAWPRTTWWSAVAVMRATKPGPDRRDRSADGQPSQAAPGVRRGGCRYSSRPRNTWRNWACRTAST